ncbi:MAG: hypothetical protein HQ507_06715 [Candidatus Marinimicrobia bacterium]|nr:hypothetical protein [Candidatus Neomarinimicrobiota bacterium]
MNVRHTKTTAYMGMAAVLLLILLFIPFSQHDTLKAVVLPALEFQILSIGSGTYATVLTDNWSNQTLTTRSFVPDRGGLIHYEARRLRGGGLVTVGDTLAALYSSTVMDKIATLEGNITTLRASLDYERSGARDTEIEAARLGLEYAKTRHAEQLKVLERSKILLERNVITLAEYEIDERRERLDAIRVSIAEADLGSALTGAQSSRLEIFRSQIADEVRKLNITKQVLAEMTLTSPISGHLFFPLDTDSLLMVGNTDSMVVMLPIQKGSQGRVDWGSNLILNGIDFQIEVQPQHISLENQILRSGNNQLVLARILVDNSAQKLRPGQLLETTMRYESRSVFQILKDLF